MFHQKILLQPIKVKPHPSLKHQIMHYNHNTFNPALLFVHSTSRPPLSFPLILIWMCFIFFSQGPAAPLRVPALWMPPGKWALLLSFPNCAFCTFNHVSLSRADYRRLSSLEKVRAGIRASWGIRSPNWFQLSLLSNDHFFSRTDGAVARTLEEGGGAFFSPLLCFFGISKGLYAGQLQRDLKPLLNINHMVVPVSLSPCYIFSMLKRMRERRSEKTGWKRKVERSLGLSGQFAFATAQGIPFQVKKVAPGWQSPPDDLRLHTGKATGARPAG